MPNKTTPRTPKVNEEVLSWFDVTKYRDSYNFTGKQWAENLQLRAEARALLKFYSEQQVVEAIEWFHEAINRIRDKPLITNLEKFTKGEWSNRIEWFRKEQYLSFDKDPSLKQLRKENLSYSHLTNLNVYHANNIRHYMDEFGITKEMQFSDYIEHTSDLSYDSMVNTYEQDSDGEPLSLSKQHLIVTPFVHIDTLVEQLTHWHKAFHKNVLSINSDSDSDSTASTKSKLYKNAVLPYLDLMLWSEINDTVIPHDQLKNLLSNEQMGNPSIKPTRTKEGAEIAIKWTFISSLRALN